LRTRRRRRLTVALATFALVLIATSILSVAGAINLPIIGGLNGGVNDLGTVGLGLGQTPTAVATQHNAEPPLTATPAPTCGPNSKPEPGIDGRVPAGSGDNGLWCNIQLIAHQGTSGGFKVFRYVDAAGHVCAFYDTALLFPTNAINPGGASLGVAVLNMADPAHPVQTDTLTQLPMLTPHESLNLNPARGLLAAVDGNPATEPGLFSIYDVHNDCLHPTLDATKLVARFGHESGFSPDGKTFYATATAIDVSNPKDPHAIWQGNIMAHGMTLSDNGDTAYIADPTGALTILNVSQIQDRKPNPQVTEISRLTWKSVSIPQNAIPFTEDGHPYLLEFDEYTAGTLNPTASRDVIGAARIIDIANPAHPFVVSNMRLAVDQPAAHKAAGNDPGTLSPAQGYAAHYCNIPTEVNPKLVACSFIASGLRVFNISDILHPREVAYFVAPTKPNTETGYTASDYAMSKPAFDVARHDIWYTDGGTGFYVLHVTNGAWPASTTPPPTTCSHEGQLSGSSLGPVALGMTRSRVRSIGCLKHDGIQVKYKRSKVVLALTANRHYALRGARPRTKLAKVKGRLHLKRGIKSGQNTWYLVPAGRSRGVLEVRHGVIEKIGIASKPLTASRGGARKLLAGVS
jgi:hypothetical protein